jgi:DNA repair protein RadC
MNKTMEDKFTIKQWAEDDRPREKLLLKGKAGLSDAELIAILIATGTKEDSAVAVAQKVLHLTQNNLTELGRLSVTDLKKIKGIGEAKAITIVAALELGRRRNQEQAETTQQFLTSHDSYSLFAPILSDLPHEEFWVLLLNRAHKMIDYKRLSEGGVSGTIVDIKIALKYAVENLASVIVICHNHPSGNPQPSELDRALTKKLKAAASLLEITMVDHIIIARDTYYSFSDHDEIK